MSFRSTNNNKNRRPPPSKSRLGMTSWHHGKKRIPKSVNKPSRSKLRNAGRFVRYGYEPATTCDDEEHGLIEEEDEEEREEEEREQYGGYIALDGRTFTGHKDSVSGADDYIDHPMMTTAAVVSEMNKNPDIMRNNQHDYAISRRHSPPRRMTTIKARGMKRHRTFNNNNNNNSNIYRNTPVMSQNVPLSMYGITVENYDDDAHKYGGTQDYFQTPQQTAFPSLATYGRNVDHAGLGLYITNSYLDHFSCTTLSYLIVGCILCIIIALVIAILVVAFTG